MKAAPATPSSWFSMTQGSRLKPLLQKDGFCRRGFSPELSVFDDAGVAVKAASSIPSSWLSMAQRSRRKPLLQKTAFVGGISLRTSALDGARVAAEARDASW